MGGKYASQLELASFHTVSKGAYGECGLRGGYFDLMNFHQGTVDEFYKVCPPASQPHSMPHAASVRSVS